MGYFCLPLWWKERHKINSNNWQRNANFLAVVCYRKDQQQNCDLFGAFKPFKDICPKSSHLFKKRLKTFLEDEHNICPGGSPAKHNLELKQKQTLRIIVIVHSDGLGLHYFGHLSCPCVLVRAGEGHHKASGLYSQTKFHRHFPSFYLFNPNDSRIRFDPNHRSFLGVYHPSSSWFEHV